jgi:BASS family bile acid:Na+ symporter
VDTLIIVGIKASIFLLVVSVGLGAARGEQRYVLRRPGQIARSLFAMNIVMPLVAAALAVALSLSPPVTIALIALAVSPVPPILPRKQLKAGGSAEYVIALLACAALFSIVFVPVAIDALSTAFGNPVHVGARVIARTVLTTVLIPLGVGIGIRWLAPRFAERLQGPLGKIAALLLVAGVVPLVVRLWPAMAALIGGGALGAIVIFSILGHALGHWLGGPEPGDRTVLALATAARHPGVALAIATVGFPQQRMAVIPAILLVLVVNLFTSALYLAWSRRHAAEHPARGAPEVQPGAT